MMASSLVFWIAFALAAPVPHRDDNQLTMQIRTLTHEGAAKALDAAVAEASAKGFRVSIAVVDAAGNLVAFRRLGNAMPVSIVNAIAKARTAAELGAPSKVVQDIIDSGKPSYLAVEGISPLQGGVPIISNGEVIGGIGSSGVASEDDEKIAGAGAAALIKALEK